MSRTTLIVNSTPCLEGTEALAYYSKYAGAILKEHKGKLVNKYKITDTLTQDKIYQTVMIMEFEDNSIIDALENGEDYQALISYREKAFSKISIVFAETV